MAASTLDGSAQALIAAIRAEAPTRVTPAGIVATGEHILLADFDGGRILRFDLSGEPGVAWEDLGRFDGPIALAAGPDDHLYVADLTGQRVQKFTHDGRYVSGWGAPGSAPGQFDGPMGVAVDAEGFVYVTDLANHRVQKFSSDGAFVTSWGGHGNGPGELNDPWGIAIDGAGDLLVADHGNHRVQKFSSDGVFIDAWGVAGSEPGTLLGPMAIAIAADGSVFITDLVSRRVQQFDSEGTFLSLWEAEGDDASYRWGLALDRSGALYAANGGLEVPERIARDAFSAPPAPRPTAFALSRVWPNPSVGSTTLRFGIPSRGHLRVDIFGVDGRRVRRLVDGAVLAGETRLTWDGTTERGRPAAAGIYFVRGWLDAAGARRALEGRIVRLR